MKNILAFMMALATASVVAAPQEINYGTVRKPQSESYDVIVDATSPIITTEIKPYSVQAAYRYFNNDLWVRTGSWLNKMVSQNWGHQKQLRELHQVVMPVDMVVINKSDKPVYLPVHGWVKGLDYSFNAASLAAVYPQQWAQFAASAAVMLAGVCVLSSPRVVIRRGALVAPGRLRLPIGAALLALGGYTANKFWKGRTTSNALRELQPHVVRVLDGKRLAFKVNVRSVNNVDYYELPANSSFEMKVFAPRISNSDVKTLGVNMTTALPAE